MRKRLAAFAGTVRRMVGDFNTVRLGANRDVAHVVRVGRVAHFQPSRELREFGNAYCRLPRWARWLAVRISERNPKQI